MAKSGGSVRAVRPGGARKEAFRKARIGFERGKDGIVWWCPFCKQKHALKLEGEAPCGTRLEFLALQQTWGNVSCVLCQQTGGTMIRIGDAYRHAHDCKPGFTLFTTPPKPSLSARLAWAMPQRFQRWIWRRFKRQVIQLHKDGKVTGYSWESQR